MCKIFLKKSLHSLTQVCYTNSDVFFGKYTSLWQTDIAIDVFFKICLGIGPGRLEKDVKENFFLHNLK